MNIPVFDLHCDTALAMLDEQLRPSGNLKSNTMHIDLDRASGLEAYAQCFACFTSPMENIPGGLKVEDVFERELAVVQRELHTNSDLIRQAYRAEDVERNRENGIMSAILTIEGPAGFGFDPELLGMLYQAGFRITTLGWNEKNVLTGSHVTGGGLTDLGRTYVQKAQRVGMIVDVSHISDEGFWDIMDITQKPVIASHSNSRAVWGSSRNLTDDMFKAICETGGVAGINQYIRFLGEDGADLDAACDHVFHFLELDPDGKHIALGGDLDGCSGFCKGFSGVQDYPAFAQRLLDRGLTETVLLDIFWNNALDVMRKCCM